VTLVAGVVLPHAPLLLPEVTQVERAADVVHAAREIGAGVDATVIVVSPHGERSGVYAGTRGSLRRLGPPDVVGQADPAPEVAQALARAWDRPLLTGEVDHGVAVPLRMALGTTRAIGVSLQETTGPGAGDLAAALEDARELAGCIGALPDPTVVVASAHTSAALTRRAPLTELPAGRELDAAIIDALGTDIGRLTEIPERAWTEGGSCGAGPLVVLGHLFRGRRATVLAYDYPVGVGYLVATVEPSP
jgi:aromatic ring-opening dioxygenase LigB subunit